MSSSSRPFAHRPKVTATEDVSPASHGTGTRDSQNFRGGRAPGPHDVFIAVMGVTGSGKSSFISLCSGEKVPVGHALGACTSTVDVYAYDMSPERTVYLIDTPGFDDTQRSDTQVLSEIATWLGDSYRNKILLNGILYLHRITDIRMQGSAKRNLIMFRQLCGQDALKKVLLVTTMWDKLSSEDGIKRETELIDTPEFWGWMVEKGSSCHRHYNTEASAKDLIHQLAKHNAPVATSLQRQLVDEGRKLDQTSAGQELQSELRKEKEKWAKERQEIEVQLQAAIRQRDRETEQTMREERDRYTRMVQKVEDDTNALRSTMENLLAKRDVRVTQMEKQMLEQQAVHKEELRRIETRQQRLEQERAELAKQVGEARKQEPRKSPNQKRQQAQAQKTGSKTTQAYPKYSVSMHGTYFTCIGPNQQWCGNFHASTDDLGPDQQAVSIGDVYKGGRRCWVCRDSDGTWRESKSLGKQYPHLSAKISSHDLDNLELCALGPGQKYYARWKDGNWGAWAAPESVQLLQAYDGVGSGGHVIMAVAFGYGGSYLISHGKPSDPQQSGYELNLKGYYARLAQFLSETSNLSIIAITLNPTNRTDYIIIWKDSFGKGHTMCQWYSSDSETSQSIRLWWDKVCAR